MKEFDSLTAAGKTRSPESPNALELIGNLTQQYGERPEFVRMRGVLAAKLAEPAMLTVNKTVADSRGVGRDEIVRVLDGLINSIALKSDDNRVQAEAAYLRGILSLRDGQAGSGTGDAGQGGADGQAKTGAARAEFESALKFDEAFTPARYQLGLLLVTSGDLAGAEPTS